MTMNRKDEYQDERWKERAAEIRKLDHNKCAMCGAKDVELHVHHLAYPPPPCHIWDAADSELVTLCKDCHATVHETEERPTLSKDRQLSYKTQYRIDGKTGCRMVSPSLYGKLRKNGYDGSPYTQPIIDWLRECCWIVIQVKVIPLCEKYEDGRERERAADFGIYSSIYQIRTCCETGCGKTQYNEWAQEWIYEGSYEDAEIDAITCAVEAGYAYPFHEKWKHLPCSKKDFDKLNQPPKIKESQKKEPTIKLGDCLMTFANMKKEQSINKEQLNLW